MDGEKKEVMTIDKFGLCPMCGKLMGALESQYTMYGLTPNGKYPNSILGRENDVTFACECGYRCQMQRTVDGFYPKKHEKLQELDDEAVKQLAHTIGYIEGEKTNEN